MLPNYISAQIFCSQFGFIHWLQNHLIPCPFKYLPVLIALVAVFSAL
jgi:hypothetical protein